mmetsp:Transcript_15153/g.22746  ORF Transcript_15153/g.22746 Transcript_15153/m.22746 type:complete len:308 (+) Transcript_15153:123-1046(+)
MDIEFEDYLKKGLEDESTAEIALSLVRRAQELARREKFSENTFLKNGIDVVASACGFKILYFLGVYMVFDAANIEVKRFSGASSGGMTPMELVVLGTLNTVSLYCFYGALQDKYTASFFASAWRADRHWKMLAAYLFPESNESAKQLDGRVFVSISRLTWRGLRNVVVSDYDSQERARAAYYATGTLVTSLDGYLCTDGGITNAEPCFHDNQRTQLLIRPPKISNDMVARFSLEEVKNVIKRGQDDALLFLCRMNREIPPPSILSSSSIDYTSNDSNNLLRFSSSSSTILGAGGIQLLTLSAPSSLL